MDILQCCDIDRSHDVNMRPLSPLRLYPTTYGYFGLLATHDIERRHNNFPHTCIIRQRGASRLAGQASLPEAGGPQVSRSAAGSAAEARPSLEPAGAEVGVGRYVTRCTAAFYFRKGAFGAVSGSEVVSCRGAQGKQIFWELLGSLLMLA